SVLVQADNVNNPTWRYAYDDQGNLVQSIEPSGAVHMFRHDDDRRLVEAYPYIGHAGVQGNWVGHFGQDGIILCAFDGDSDRVSVPLVDLGESKVPRFEVVAPDSLPFQRL